jgi:hypothetical protein
MEGTVDRVQSSTYGRCSIEDIYRRISNPAYPSLVGLEITDGVHDGRTAIIY